MSLQFACMSHWLHVFDFSLLCILKWIFRLPLRDDAHSHWLFSTVNFQMSPQMSYHSRFDIVKTQCQDEFTYQSGIPIPVIWDIISDFNVKYWQILLTNKNTLHANTWKGDTDQHGISLLICSDYVILYARFKRDPTHDGS